MKLLLLVDIGGARMAPDWVPPGSVVTPIPDELTSELRRARLHDAAESMADYIDEHGEIPGLDDHLARAAR